MTDAEHIYEVRPRKDHRGVDLISDVLPFGRLTTDFRCVPASQDRAGIADDSLAASAASTSGKIRNVRSSREISKIERMVSCKPLKKNSPPYASTSCMARISAATPALSM